MRRLLLSLDIGQHDGDFHCKKGISEISKVLLNDIFAEFDESNQTEEYY